MFDFLRLLPLAILFGTGVHAAEHEILKTFPLPVGGVLVVDSYRGDIVIEEGRKPEANVAIHFDYDVDTDEDAEKLWAGIELQLRPEGNQVFVAIRNPVETGPRLSWHEKNRVTPHIRVVVPHECNLNLSTRNGHIMVGPMAGHMSAHVEHGTIFFRRIDGAVVAESQDGDIVISHCTGDVSARALRGTVRVGLIGGNGRLKTTNGAIDVMLARGALSAEADVGDVSVGFGATVAAPATITSAAGNVRVTFAPEASCEVEASASWGRIDSELKLAGANVARGKRLAGRLNAGGPLVKIRAAGGSVKLESSAD